MNLHYVTRVFSIMSPSLREEVLEGVRTHPELPPRAAPRLHGTPTLEDIAEATGIEVSDLLDEDFWYEPFSELCSGENWLRSLKLASLADLRALGWRVVERFIAVNLADDVLSGLWADPGAWGPMRANFTTLDALLQHQGDPASYASLASLLESFDSSMAEDGQNTPKEVFFIEHWGALLRAETHEDYQEVLCELIACLMGRPGWALNLDDGEWGQEVFVPFIAEHGGLMGERITFAR